MGFFKNLGVKIERWLMSDEIKLMEQESQQIQPEDDVLLDYLKMAEDKRKYINHQLEMITSEDHSIKPTQADIERYFEYHTQYVGWMTEIKKNVWSTSDIKLIEKSEFETKGRLEGWVFLRNSCGLPQGDITKEPNLQNK